MSFRPNTSFLLRLASIGVLGAGLSACSDTQNMSSARAWKPIPAETLALMSAKDTDAHQPILIRTYKKEAEFEIWKMKKDGQYTLLKTYPMCRWSGQLGPKVREGDRQVPEGFYSIAPGQMNPNSNYYLSFNVGYPNAYDRALGHTGGSIMVHGACSSAGCFSMTDTQIGEIYAVAREAFGGGQRAIQMQSLPFRMTAENLAKHRLDPNMPFWRQLKQGADHFEVAKREPSVGVCGRHYVFDAQPTGGGRIDPEGPCPALTEDPSIRSLVAEKEASDSAKVAELVAKGVKPVRVMYADGGQNPEFANVDEVSRPEALAAGPVEIALDDRGKPKKAQMAVQAGRPGSKPAEAAPETFAAKSQETEPSSLAASSPAAPVALAATGSSTGDAIGRWLGLNKAEQALPAARPSTPDTVLVTDPDKPEKYVKAKPASVASRPQASRDDSADATKMAAYGAAR